MQNQKSEYKGNELKSKAERLVAIDLDRQNLTWMYEPHTFKFSSGWYVPDFFVSDYTSGTWIEVKSYIFPHDLTSTEATKLYCLCEEVPAVVYLALPYHGFRGTVSYYSIDTNSEGITWPEEPIKEIR